VTSATLLGWVWAEIPTERSPSKFDKRKREDEEMKKMKQKSGKFTNKITDYQIKVTTFHGLHCNHIPV